MPTFLKQTAGDILQKYPDLKDVGIILPSRRAAVFLKRELARQIHKPVFSPYISTIEDFVLETLGLEQADRPALIFKLYECYTEVAGEPRESFAEFNQWAHLLLADFNEIDRYLVDAPKLFSYLADIERIKSWDLQPGEEIPEMVWNYLRLWQSLPELYRAFSKKQLREKRVYQGLAYRQMAEKLEDYTGRLREKHQKLIFIGFNALNTAEEKILLSLYREGVAEFYWDVDGYYFEDSHQEAGNFLRKSKLLRELMARGDFKWKHNSLKTIPKKIEIVNATGNHLQMVEANGAVLKYQQAGLEDVAVVLADEARLPVFLNNLAAGIPSLNITMGLPLSDTPVAGFFQMLINMFQDREKSKKESKIPALFHYQRWDDLMAHPLFVLWCENKTPVALVRKKIREQNRIFISADELNEWSGGVLPVEMIRFFNREYSGSPALLWRELAQLTLQLNEQNDRKNELLQALFGFYKLFNRLSDLMDQYPYLKDIQTAARFYRDLLSSETLDLYGEPLSGLQVMGMLETRTLDFKNLIITSLNEDILPKGRSENSLIPFDVKREFGLPTYLDKDAVFAYHFYRLLQRAENVVLIYNGLSEGLGSGEQSRFITQLEYELKRVNPAVEISRRNPSFEVKTSDETARKTPFVMQRLRELAEKGFSASALIDYLNDPFVFYKKRILQLTEPEEVEEVAGYNTQGNVVHDLLEKFYSGEKGVPKPVLEPGDEVFGQSREQVRNQVVQWLEEKAGLHDLHLGKNLLIREVLTQMIFNFLRKEREELEMMRKNGEVLSILGLEKELWSNIRLKDGTVVNLKGFVDRIDRTGDRIRVMDYKTGFVNKGKLNVKSTADLRAPDDGNKAFQLMLYAWLFLKNNPEVESVQAAIISLRNINDWPMYLSYGDRRERTKDISRELTQEFDRFLVELLEEIFDPSVDFSKKLLTLNIDD